MMNQYRLQLDIPLGNNQDDAVQTALTFLGMMRAFEVDDTLPANFLRACQVRMTNDGDRSSKNYLDQLPNGNYSQRKLPLFSSTDT